MLYNLEIATTGHFSLVRFQDATAGVSVVIRGNFVLKAFVAKITSDLEFPGRADIIGGTPSYSGHESCVYHSRKHDHSQLNNNWSKSTTCIMPFLLLCLHDRSMSFLSI